MYDRGVSEFVGPVPATVGTGGSIGEMVDVNIEDDRATPHVRKAIAIEGMI